MRTDSIISKPKENIKNLNVYHEKNIMCELFVEKSYFIGNNIYKNFIDEVFFNDLVEQNICQFKNLLIKDILLKKNLKSSNYYIIN